MKIILWNLMPLIFLLMLMVGVLVFTAAFTLVERKLMGLHQRREGPDRVGFEGLGQPFADGLKLLRKETLLPKDSPERRVFFMAPLLSLWVSLLLWTLVPLSPAGPFVAEELGLLLVLGLSSLSSYGVIYAGWASNNKYALLGAFRAVAQFISYEIVFSLLFLPLIGVTGSANLQNLVDYQLQEGWFSYLVPLWGLSFLVILAETNRTPFDLPEAEAELVAGFNVEYSSLLFAFFFLAEYSAMGFFGALMVTLFFGGYGLMPIIGWGWDGDRPMDAFTAYWKLQVRNRVNAKLSAQICEPDTCHLPPRLSAHNNQRSWPLNDQLYPHNGAVYWLKNFRQPRLQHLGDIWHQLRQTQRVLNPSLPPLNAEEGFWDPHRDHCDYPHRVDQLFRAFEPRGMFGARIFNLNEALLTQYEIWDAALLNPVDFRDTLLWVALLPGLVAVPILALKVQLFCVAFILVRASLPRLRFDQLTLLCWKYIFPLALSGSLVVMGLHYGFTIYYMALETRTFPIYWLPRFYYLPFALGFDLDLTQMINSDNLVRFRHTHIALPLQEILKDCPNWAAELALQNRWGGWNPGRSWLCWTKQRPDWLFMGSRKAELYDNPSQVHPPLPADHAQYEQAAAEASALDRRR